MEINFSKDPIDTPKQMFVNMSTSTKLCTQVTVAKGSLLKQDINQQMTTSLSKSVLNVGLSGTK